MNFTIEPMGIGEILPRGVRLLFSRLGAFLAIQIIVAAPTLILKLVLPEVSTGGFTLLLVLPTFILGPIGSAAMLHVIAQQYIGQPASLGSAFKFALGRFLPLVGTDIVAGFGVLLGVLACLIPGIYLAVIWAFVSQVVVMENTAGYAALGRSKELVQGYFFHVFGVLFVLGCAFLVLSLPLAFILPSVLPFQEAIPNPNNPFAPGMRITNYANFAINQAVGTTVGGLIQTLSAICTTLLYFDLRNRKEAFDVQHIVAWMDQYRDWRDEPVPEMLPTGGAATPETGIKPAGATVPPPETGIQDANAPRPDTAPP
jgi:hypothetical protein